MLPDNGKGLIDKPSNHSLDETSRSSKEFSRRRELLCSCWLITVEKRQRRE
jgi:hypothetical protein